MQISRNFSLMVAGLFVMTVMGAGCGSPKPPVPDQKLPENGLLDGKVVETPGFTFSPGDSFEVRVGSSKTNLNRSITLQRFTSRSFAELSWKNLVTTSTAKSAATGTLIGISLRTPHKLNLPSVWRSGSTNLLEQSSGVWLSDDAYLELSRTKKTTLDLGVREVAYAALKAAATEVEKTRDPNSTPLDAEFASSTLMINDVTTTVSVIRARNWFGEFTVLDDRQNPLVLKFVLDPDSTNIIKTSKEFLALANLLNFEVVSLKLSSRP